MCSFPTTDLVLMPDSVLESSLYWYGLSAGKRPSGSGPAGLVFSVLSETVEIGCLQIGSVGDKLAVFGKNGEESQSEGFPLSFQRCECRTF